GQRHDLHKVALAQFAGDRAEDARAARLQVVLNHDRSVVIEAQHRAVFATDRMPCSHDHALDDIALLDLLVRRGGLHNTNDNVANMSVARVGAFHYTYAQYLARAGVVRTAHAGIRL